MKSLVLIRIGVVFLLGVLIFGVFFTKKLIAHEFPNAGVADTKFDQTGQNFLDDESQLTADMRKLRRRLHVGASSKEISALREFVVEDWNKIISDRTIHNQKAPL